METLSIKDLYDGLEKLKDWELRGNQITKELVFSDSQKAADFVQKVNEEAEKAQHHPSVSVEDNKVTLSLTTHSANGLTQKDFELTNIIDKLV